MKNLMLLCLSLLTGQHCAEMMETLSTNKTVTLHRNMNFNSSMCNETVTSYTVNFINTTARPDKILCGNNSNTISGNNTTGQTHSGNFSNAISRSSRSDRGNFSHTTSVYDINENVDLIYTTSKYHNIATTLGFKFSNITILNTDNDTNLRSGVESRTLKSELLSVRPNTNPILIDKTYDTDNSHTDLTNHEFRNDYKVNNESKLEVEVDDHEERNEKVLNGTDAGEEEKRVDEEHKFLDRRKIYMTAYTIWNVIGSVGIVANVCLLMVFILRKDMRTYHNMMIINLAISDILSIIFNVPLHILQQPFITWHTGDFLCKVYFWARYTTINSSIYCVVIISLQRLFALSNFFTINASKYLIFGKYKSFLVILSVWILAGALALRYNEAVFIEDLRCYLHYHISGKYNDVADLILYCVIPLIIIGFSSVLTSIRIKESVKNMPGENSVNCKAKRDRAVSSNVLLVLTIVFAASYFPLFSYYVYQSWNELKVDMYIDDAVYGLIFANSCFNPIALFIMSRKYRRILRDFLCRKKYPGSSRDRRENSTITAETVM